MTKSLFLAASVLSSAACWAAVGSSVIYGVNGENYEGYYADAGPQAPLILLPWPRSWGTPV